MTVTANIFRTLFHVSLPLCLLVCPLVQARVPDFVDLIEQNSPTVVKIQVEQPLPEYPDDLPPIDKLPEMLRDFFDHYGRPKVAPTAAASGFILSPDGYIVTNSHVVEGASAVKVSLIDRREYSASIVGVDSKSDLALLRIDGDNLASVKLAKNDHLRVGEWVIAIGSPFGLDYSASVGIVSAIGRSLPSDAGENYVPFIQTDVAINPGNSGGPLFNQDGEVVGINSQIYTNSGGSMGISFAIPIAVARTVLSQLQEKGVVERGWLGVYIQDVDQMLAESLQLKSPRGALVAAVIPDSPAHQAGLQDGDVIVAVDSEEVVESGDLPHAIGLVAPGKSVNLRIVRGGREQLVDVVIGKLPEDQSASRALGASTESNGLGLDVHGIDQTTAAAIGIQGGVVVEKVYPHSPAAYTGLVPGDVIVRLGDVEVAGEDDYKRALGALPKGTPVLIRFLRKGKYTFRTIELAP